METPKNETFAVALAHQGETGWEMVRDARERGEPYAMAFVDMLMPPGWDGLETAERMWEDDPALEIAICTAYGGEREREFSHRFERNLHQLLILQKPFDLCEVRNIASMLTYKRTVANELSELRVLGSS